MKKYYKLVTINLIILFLLLIGLNFFIEKKVLQDNIKLVQFLREKIWELNVQKIDFSKIDISEYDVEPKVVKKIEYNNTIFNKFCGEERIEYGFEKKYKNAPIILMGCSYAYGHGIRKEQTFSYLLSELTQRPVINMARCGGALISSYWNFNEYIFNSKENEKKINNAEYVIYVYMWDHINRLINSHKYLYDNYNELFNPIGIEKLAISVPLIKYFLLILRFNDVIKGYPNTDKSSILLKSIIINIKNKIHQHAPNAKVIIIIYDEKLPSSLGTVIIKFLQDTMNSEIWKELQQKENITVVHTKDLIGIVFDKEYKLKEDIEDWHPNARAWELFTPLFAKEYIK